jgi:ArsR family transcriptional regulator
MVFQISSTALGDIEDPPIDAGSMDVALFSQALHHAAAPQRALNAAYGYYKPGGRVLILDLLSQTREQTRELYGHVWLGFSEIELHRLLKRSRLSPKSNPPSSRGNRRHRFSKLCWRRA